MQEGSTTHEEPSVDWHTMLAYALTGEWLVLPEGAGGAQHVPDPDRLLADLAGLGWSGAKLAESAATRRAVPVDRVRALGPARWTVVLEQMRRRVLAMEVRTATRRSMDADERRLAADRPPHWG